MHKILAPTINATWFLCYYLLSRIHKKVVHLFSVVNYYIVVFNSNHFVNIHNSIQQCELYLIDKRVNTVAYCNIKYGKIKNTTESIVQDYSLFLQLQYPLLIYNKCIANYCTSSLNTVSQMYIAFCLGYFYQGMCAQHNVHLLAVARMRNSEQL